MSPIAEAAARIISQLPPAKAQEALDFALFLAEKTDEEAWEARLAKAGESRRFRDAADKARRDADAGHATPLEFDQP